MSLMLEIYYPSPLAIDLLGAIETIVAEFGGEITYREQSGVNAECLTVEFEGTSSAEAAAAKLRMKALHVEGPVTYGEN